MNPETFKPGHPGRLVRVGGGHGSYWAYVPDPLPASVQWRSSLLTVLSAADRALGRLAGVGQNLPNPHLLIGPFMRREAVLSSRIEGTQASLSDLVLFEAIPDAEPRIADVREVYNYVRALEHGMSRLSTPPMSLRLVREMHELLMRGVRGDSANPGEFRTIQNWIGPSGGSISDATFVPPPPKELIPALNAFESYLHAKTDLPPLVRLAMVHYQFEAIHPFLDGNGRIGRLLITLLLCMEGILPGPLLYLSAYLERERNAYYSHLLAVSREGKWDEWVEFFLRGVAEQSMDAVTRATRLVELRDEYRRRLTGVRGSALPLRLADELFAHPAVSVARVCDALGVTRRSAQINVDKLVAAGILREVTGKRRNRVYVAEGIVRAVQ
ncbi:MAG: Fic family protein [Phycisphaeraceae bacterium]|nr:Fic family protein [Phycisphaeraceae bacterium]